MTSLLTMWVACITNFDQWETFNDVTHQNIPRNRTGVVAEILCVAGSVCGEWYFTMACQNDFSVKIWYPCNIVSLFWIHSSKLYHFSQTAVIE